MLVYAQYRQGNRDTLRRPGGQVACPSSCREKQVELEFEPAYPTGSGDRVVSCPGTIPTESSSLAPRLSWQPAPWGPHSQHGTGHAQLGAAFCPPRCPSADLISSQGHEQGVEGRGQRCENLGDGDRVNRQLWDAGYQNLDQNSSTRRPQGTHRSRGGCRSVTWSGRAGPRPPPP